MWIFIYLVSMLLCLVAVALVYFNPAFSKMAEIESYFGLLVLFLVAFMPIVNSAAFLMVVMMVGLSRTEYSWRIHK